MTTSKREREAHTAVAAYLHEAHPGADWPAIDDMRWAVERDLYNGPPSFDEVESWQFVYPGFAEGCKRLSELIEPLPVEVWYDFDSGCVAETDPYQWPGNWTEGGEGDGDVDEELPEYVGPDDTRTVPTIEALFDRELWRYLT